MRGAHRDTVGALARAARDLGFFSRDFGIQAPENPKFYLACRVMKACSLRSGSRLACKDIDLRTPHIGVHTQTTVQTDTVGGPDLLLKRWWGGGRPSGLGTRAFRARDRVARPQDGVALAEDREPDIQVVTMLG